MNRIHRRIWQLPASDNPLSADVFIIEGDGRYYVFDVGSCDEAYAAIRALEKPVTVILSHFHQDHIGNMSRLTPEATLAGARTLKHLAGGTLVDCPLTIHDGVDILVQPCVSPHAPGCLIATVDGPYTLIGDLTYAYPGQKQGEAKGMLRALQALDTQFFLSSHAQNNPLVEKAAMLREIRAKLNI